MKMSETALVPVSNSVTVSIGDTRVTVRPYHIPARVIKAAKRADAVLTALIEREQEAMKFYRDENANLRKTVQRIERKILGKRVRRAQATNESLLQKAVDLEPLAAVDLEPLAEVYSQNDRQDTL